MWRTVRRFWRLFAMATALVGLVRMVRPKYLGWQATDDERRRELPGDALVSRPTLVATRAITIRASAKDTWPWIAQLGQGRGGFYSYDWLENLANCDIQSANEIVPEWQTIEPGDKVHLTPTVALDVAIAEPGSALVLRAAAPLDQAAPPYDFTWAFVLEPIGAGATRLLVRERYGYTRWWARLLVEPVQVMSFVMTERMLRGIKTRAELSGR